jgi:hypothetical protein
MNDPIVWIVNAQHWPRAYLRAELIERGLDAVGYEDLGDALAALHGPGAARPAVVVLELCDLSLTQDSLDALAEAEIPTILLGGAVELRSPLVRGFPWAATLQRPFTIGQAADLVAELLALQKGT